MPSDIFPKKIVVGAMGLPISEKRFLLTRRHAPGLKAWHNKWQIAGGALEFSETPEAAMIREFDEELKVVPKIIHPQPIVKTSIWYAHETEKKHDAQIILITYLVDIGDQKIDISADHETSAFEWFSFDQIRNLSALPMTIEIVDEAQELIKINNLVK